jgi:putative transposase
VGQNSRDRLEWVIAQEIVGAGKVKMSFQTTLHHRRSIRLPGYDYAQAGAYFVTLLTQGRELLFGEVVEDQMQVNLAGQCAAAVLLSLPRFFEVQVDEWILMPNHLHAILVIGTGDRKGEASGWLPVLKKTDWSPDASPLPAQTSQTSQTSRPNGTQPGSLAAILQNFKSVTTHRINAARAAPGLSVWQRNYYEHVIRSEAEWERIRAYIADNPRRWAEDQENPAGRVEEN